jgi:hypothetical protein
MNYNVEIYHNRLNLILEEYDGDFGNNYDLSGLKSEISRITGTDTSISIVPLGEMTAYRKVRDAKSIIKVVDKRNESRQEMPSTL